MAFQNIDPIWILQPLGFILLSAGVVLYWRIKRRFSGAALLFSFLAYAGAIVIKVVFQDLTYSKLISSSFGQNNYVLGFYFGIQTSIFEVGGAYLVAATAYRWNKLRANDAEGYGIGLGFWENGILLGILPLINLVADYAILSIGGNSQIAKTVYTSLNSSAPSYFFPPAQALPIIGYSFMERVTSLLFHFSWGYLCLLAVCFKRRQLFYIALPMGMLDFSVPFAGELGTGVYETTILLIAIVVTFATIRLTKDIRRQIGAASSQNQPASPPPANPQDLKGNLNAYSGTFER